MTKLAHGQAIEEARLCAPKVANLLHMKAWTVETLNATVDAELEALPADLRERYEFIADMIEARGLEKVGTPHIDHIDRDLWEIRMKGAEGIARALYVTAKRKKVVVVRVFVKKTQKTPRQEIELALKRAKDATDPRDRFARNVDEGARLREGLCQA
jgi:phage-related protein